jgi:REP element-mobilizing transposase RayT
MPNMRQLKLVFDRRRRKRRRKRRRAGRKPTIPGEPRLRHAPRPAADPRLPVHITVRMRPDVPRLRNYELCKTLRRAFVYGCVKDEFRICQFSIQRNHIHLVCEAATADARARGVQGWAVRVARGINRHAGRSGGVFTDRYHLEVLKTPTQVRNALCYVLQNARRHGTRLEPRFHGADPFSSAWWFDGWRDPDWKDGLDPPEQRTVAEPKSWMLRDGWRRSRGGLIAIDEVPPAAKGLRIH